MILQERQENFFDDTPGTSQKTFFRFLNKKKMMILQERQENFFSVFK